jgi:hypothetical protein
MLGSLKKIIGLLLITIIFTSIGIISILNISGGFKISNFEIGNFIDPTLKENIQKKEVHLKIGTHLIFVVSDLKLTTPEVEINAETLIINKSILSALLGKEAISSILIENAEIKTYVNQGENLEDGLKKLTTLFSKDSNHGDVNLSNVTFIFSEKISGISQKIENFTGEIQTKAPNFDISGNFNIGIANYTTSLSMNKKEEKINFKLESDNLSIKLNLLENAGKVRVSIHNLTKFFNDITPDTINPNLFNFDGKKNIFYIESEIKYNDVKKEVDFLNSKLQMFEGNEEQLIIESLGNRNYKITADIKEINLTETSDILPELKTNDSKIPLIQFSSLIPNINVYANIKVKNINMKTAKEVNKIEDLSFVSTLSYGKMTTALDFLYNEKINFKSEGFIENFETEQRKGFFKNSISLKSFDLENFFLNENIKLNLGKNENILILFDYTLSEENAIISDISIDIENNFKLFSSTIQYNLYRESDYSINLNLQNFNMNNIKIIQSKLFNENNSDLFKILFDYLKFKNFSYMEIKCFTCNIGDEKINMNLKFNISSGKIELETLSIFGNNIIFDVEGILDIRNPQNNLANLFINIDKWEGFSVEKLIASSKIFTDIAKFKIPSFESFSGMVKLNLFNLNNEFNKIETLKLNASLKNGILQISNSEMKINGSINTDFIKFTAVMQSSTPIISSSISFAGFELREAIKSVLKDENFKTISGISSVGIGLQTKGFLLSDLIKNASADLQVNSKVSIVDFDIEGLVGVLSNELLSFKKLSNTEIQNKMNDVGQFNLTSTTKFANMEFTIESAELKSARSTSLFVGKVGLNQAPNSIQILGKTALIGANLNTGLKGSMPIYMTQSIINPEGKEIDVKIDYSQINKYSEARRVLYK